MTIDKKSLQRISHQALSVMNELGVFTPDIYSSLFLRFASEQGIELDTSTVMTDKAFDENFLLLTDLQNKTSANVQQLSGHITQAISAIQAKDEVLLGQVLSESKKLKGEIEKLKDSLYKDELTAAYSRRWLKDSFLDSDSNNFKNSGILVMIDLNYFKIINDTYGHIIGDKVLVHMSNNLKEICDAVIRYGGDEFILIFSSTVSSEDAKKRLHQLREDILRKKFKAKNSFFKSSFSFGITKFESNDSLFDTVKAADQNMYNDKRIIKTRITGIEV